MLYHVTLMENLPSIMEQGLLPTVGPRAAELGEPSPAIYAFASIDDVENALENWLGEALPEEAEIAVIEIDLLGTPEPGQFEVILTDPVPPHLFLRILDEAFEETGHLAQTSETDAGHIVLAGHHFDEARIIQTCVRSHTGERYWDEYALSINPAMKDDDGPYRLIEDFAHLLPNPDADPEDILQSPEFRALAEEWAAARLGNVKTALEQVVGDKERIVILRTMRVSQEWLDEHQPQEGTQLEASRFGYFWQAEDASVGSAYFKAPEGCDIEIVVEAEVELDQIDLDMTVLARMDYMNGDEEGEIRLRQDGVLTLKAIERVSHEVTPR